MTSLKLHYDNRQYVLNKPFYENIFYMDYIITTLTEFYWTVDPYTLQCAKTIKLKYYYDRKLTIKNLVSYHHCCQVC